MTLFREHYNIPLVHVDARKLFLDALAGVLDPEKKRKTIGALFIEVFEKRSQHKIGGAGFGSGDDSFTPMSIQSVSLLPAGPRSPSSRTTTSAACRSACT